MSADYGFIIDVQGNVIGQMQLYEESIVKFAGTAKTEAHEVGESFSLMGEKMGETFKHLKGLLLTGLGISALFEGWEFIEKSKEAFEELERVVTRVDTVLKSTHFAAGFSSSEIQDQAKELSKSIVNRREEILGAQGTLLSFTNIRGDVFKKALGSTADYSTFFGTDLASGARVLGRALQDPLQGMNQLRRAGIVLTAQQKEQIKNYEQSGHLVKAQGLLLDELNKKFGGQAKAYASTDAGKIQVASKQWEELQYRIGEIISRVEVSLIPSFTKVVNAIKYAFSSDVIQFFIEHIKDLVSWALKLIPIWVGYKAIMTSIYALTKLQVLVQGLFTVAMEGTAAATEEATIAMEGFGVAIDTIGLGALVAVIGLAIEGFISMKEKINDAADAVSNLADTKDKYHQDVVDYDKLAQTGAAYQNLSPQGKNQFGLEAYQAIDKWNNQNAEQSKKDSVLQDSINKLRANTVKYTLRDPTTGKKIHNTENDELQNKLIERLSTNQSVITGNTDHVDKLTKVIQTYKIPAPKYTDPNTTLKENAFNTSNLAGASGGLGQAKIVHITIGTFQKNEGVHDLKKQSTAAIEELTRMVNNFDDSVNSQ